MQSTRPLNPIVFVACLFVIIAFPGCSKKSGEAIVAEKEYIAAGEERETPTAVTSSPEPNASALNPATSPSESVDREDYAAKPLAEDEIMVESYVMKKAVRGTSKDPRAYPGLEQWRITIRMVAGGRHFMVQAKQAQYERLKVGDRVKVRYREGNYSGTVWSAEIVD